MFDGRQNIFFLDIQEKSRRGNKTNRDAIAKRFTEKKKKKNWQTFG